MADGQILCGSVPFSSYTHSLTCSRLYVLRACVSDVWLRLWYTLLAGTCSYRKQIVNWIFFYIHKNRFSMSVRVHWLWPGPWLAAFDIYRNAHAPSTPPPFPTYNADICVCFLSAVRTHMLASQTGFSRDDAMQFRLIVINIIFVRAFAHLLGRPFLFYFLWWFAVYWCLFHTRTHTSHTSEYVPDCRCDAWPAKIVADICRCDRTRSRILRSPMPRCALPCVRVCVNANYVYMHKWAVCACDACR